MQIDLWKNIQIGCNLLIRWISFIDLKKDFDRVKLEDIVLQENTQRVLSKKALRKLIGPIVAVNTDCKTTIKVKKNKLMK